jgi:hypothetical protein
MDLIEWTDENLTCIDCGRPFVFTAGEGKFFAGKGLRTPRRCKECRALRKSTIDPPENRRPLNG